MRHNKCTYIKPHFQRIPCVKHAQLQCFWRCWYAMYTSLPGRMSGRRSLLHCFGQAFGAGSLAGHADFLLVFLQWVCIAYGTVGSTGKVDGVNLSMDISALFLYILHVLASNLAGTLVVVVASCCCCCCWLATHVQNLMHTW